MPETPVFSTAAVAAPHPRAAEAGQVILASGGNALEAVVAMAASCAVLLPHLNGFAGDGSILVREPRGRVHAIDAAGPAGALATIKRYSAKEYESLPLHGADAAATVAGVVAGWSLGLELSGALGGKLPLRLLLADAITLAREGYPVSQFEAAAMQAGLRDASGFADTFLERGEALAPGSIRRQPRLSDMLERLAHAGLMDFYRGDVGREIALDLERLGSPIERRDLETYRARISSPVSVRLDDAEIYNLAAPTDGLASLLALAIADRLPKRSRQGAAAEHWLIEATKRALTIAQTRVTDPREVEVDFSDLLAPHFVDREAQQVDVRRAAQMMSPPVDTTDAGVWIGCIDREGLAVSYVQSLYGSFGSGCVLPATGLLWNNRAAAFSLDPARANPLVPGRKPPNGLHPALAVFADDRVLAFGGGASAITAQLFSRYVNSQAGLAGAVEAPRWNLAQSRSDGTVLQMETGSDPSVMRALGQLGHAVEEQASPDPFGHAGMIVRHARNGRVEACHDPRIDGSVMGF